MILDLVAIFDLIFIDYFDFSEHLVSCQTFAPGRWRVAAKTQLEWSSLKKQVSDIKPEWKGYDSKSKVTNHVLLSRLIVNLSENVNFKL